MSPRTALIMCLLAAINLAATLEIALSSSELIKAIAAAWVALWLTLAALIPAGSIFGGKG